MGVQLRPWWTGLAWTLAQSLRRYAAWAAELLIAGAVAAAALTPFGVLTDGSAGRDGQRLSLTAGAALWLAATALLVALIRRGDPLRQGGGWGDAAHRASRMTRSRPMATIVSVPVLLLGTLDAAGAATPAAVQQLLQLVPVLVAVTLAAFAVAVTCGAILNLTARSLAPRHQERRQHRLSLGLAAPVGFGLSLAGVLGLGGSGGLAVPWARAVTPIAALTGALAAIGIGALVAALDRGPLRAWMGAAAAGLVAGLAAGGGADLLVVGGVLGGASGAAMEAGARLVRSQAILWRHRQQLPLDPGEVVYSLDGRSMEITLDTGSGTSIDTHSPPNLSDGRLTEDGWQVSQLTAVCWEGSKGRAHLLGRRPDDLIGVIRVLHPEA